MEILISHLLTVMSELQGMVIQESRDNLPWKIQKRILILRMYSMLPVHLMIIKNNLAMLSGKPGITMILILNILLITQEYLILLPSYPLNFPFPIQIRILMISNWFRAIIL